MFLKKASRVSIPYRSFSSSKPKWNETSFTRRLNIELPIIQAPMAGSTTPFLASAVSYTGALGSLACAYMEPPQIKSYLKEAMDLTRKPLSVNLFALSKLPEIDNQTKTDINSLNTFLNTIRHEIGIPTKEVTEYNLNFPSFKEQCQAIRDSFKNFNNSKMFTFTFGIPDPHELTAFKNDGWVLAGTATTPSEAVVLHDAGVDFIVAQGSEAGGHRGTFLPTHVITDALIHTQQLTRQILDDFNKKGITTGVIASGGITDGKTVSTLLQQGCAAVQIGTPFLTCEESGASAYVRGLVGQEMLTVVTSAVTGRYGRAIANTLVTRLEAAIRNGDIPAPLPFPLQHLMTSDIRTAAAKKGLADYMFILWGEHGDKCKKQTAAQFIQELVKDIRSQ